jgi:hypothetical protein
MSDGACIETNPQSWRVLDWRFLLPDPRLGRVWVAPECQQEAAAIEALGIEVVHQLDESVDTALVESRTFDVSAMERALSPGHLVRIAVTADRVGIFGPHRRPLRAWRRVLEERGWETLSCAWAAPRSAWTRAFVDVDNRRAVSHALTLVYDQRERTARLKLRATQAIVLLGGRELICRDGIVLARTPS